MTPPRIGSDGFYHPASEGEVAALVREAAVAGRIVRVRGAAHSVHAAIFAYAHRKRRPDPDGVDILLDRMRRIEADDATMRITVEAGCNLGRDPVDPSSTSTWENSLFRFMEDKQWAFPDTGGIIHQTVAGFLSTGSSGGSLQHSIGDQIVALRIVDGRGNASTLSMDEDPDRFLAAGVSVGLLGVVVAVTFQCIPAYRIIGQQSTTSEDECEIDLFGPGRDGRPSLATFLRATQHARLMWWPQRGVRRVVVWQGRRMTPEEERDPQYAMPKPYREFPVILGSTLPGQLGAGLFYLSIRWWNARGLLGGLTRMALKVVLPFVIRIFVSKDGKKGPQRFWGLWSRILPMDNGVSDWLLPTQFTEMWIPVSRAQEVMERLRDHYRAGGLAATGTYACEIYAAKQSRFWMSPACEDDVLKVDMFWYGRNSGDPAETYYPQFWELLKDFAYKLHWGKYLSDDSSTYLAPKYPKWDEFMRIRRDQDPQQVFVSGYWRKHMGIPFPGEERQPLDLKVLREVPGRLIGIVPADQCREMVKLVDDHMVAENAQDIAGIMATLVREPRFVMEYMPFSLGHWSWWVRKRWQGHEAVRAFYAGFFRSFRPLYITDLRFAVSGKGVVNSYRLEGKAFGLIPVRLTMAAVFEWDERERRFLGERVYFSERKALAEIR